MAVNFLRLSKTYLAETSSHDQQVDDLLCNALSAVYEAGRGQGPKIARQLVAAGFDLDDGQVTVFKQRIRRAYLLLAGDATEPVRKKAEERNHELKYYQHLFDDGIKSWDEVLRRIASSGVPALQEIATTRVIVLRDELEEVLREKTALETELRELTARFEKEQGSFRNDLLRVQGRQANLERIVGSMKTLAVEEVKIADIRPKPVAKEPEEVAPVVVPTPPIPRPAPPVLVERKRDEAPATPAPAPPRAVVVAPRVARPAPPRPAQLVKKPLVIASEEMLELWGRKIPKVSNFQGVTRNVQWPSYFSQVVGRQLSEAERQGALDTMEAVMRGSQGPGTPKLGWLDEARETTKAREYGTRTTIRTAQFMDNRLLIFIPEVHALVFRDVLPVLSP